MENTEQVAASPEIQPNVEAFVGAAIDAYTAYEAYVSPPNTEAPVHDSASAYIPSLMLVAEGIGASIATEAKLAVDRMVSDPEGMNALPTPPEKVGTGGAQERAQGAHKDESLDEATEGIGFGIGDSRATGDKLGVGRRLRDLEGMNAFPTPPEKVGTGGAQERAQGANKPESLDGEELEIIRDAFALKDGQFDQAALGQGLADDLRRLEAQEGWPGLKRRVHDMNKVLEADGSRFELQVQTVPGKDGASRRSLAIMDSATGEVTASTPFNPFQLKPDKPQEPLRKS